MAVPERVKNTMKKQRKKEPSTKPDKPATPFPERLRWQTPASFPPSNSLP